MATRKLPLNELQEQLTNLENGSFTSLTDDELLRSIGVVHDGCRITAPILPKGTVVYRAVRASQRPMHKSRVGYPPVQLVKVNGRLNKAGEVMFYGAFHWFTCLQECVCEEGEFFAVSGWITTEQMTFNHLGYSKKTLEEAQSGRDLPFFAQMKEEEAIRNALIREWQARVFTQRVQRGEEQLYRLPIVLTAHALSRMRQVEPSLPNAFSGVIYPSVAMHQAGDNIAILPTEVDTKMAIFEVILIRVDSITKFDDTIETKIMPYDSARADAGGNLIWGQKSQIVLPDGVDASKSQPSLLPPE